MKTVLIVMAKCQSKKLPFGMRFEEESRNVWAVTWAFPLKGQSGQREGYDSNTIDGSIQFHDDWPGCPHCENESAFLCICEKLNCHDRSESGSCAWCGNTAELGGTVTSLRGGGDI